MREHGAVSLTRWTLGGWAGVVGTVAPVIGLFVLPIWQFPGTASSGTQVRDFVQVHQGPLQWVMVLNTLGVSLWMVFGAAVWSRLHRADAGADPLIACFALGVGGLVTLLLSGFTCFDVLVLRAPAPASASLLYDLTFALLAMSGMPTAVALGAYGWVNARQKLLPQPTSVLAVVTAVAHVLLLLSFTVSEGFFSLEGQVITVVPGLLFAWIFTTGLALLRDQASAGDAR